MRNENQRRRWFVWWWCGEKKNKFNNVEYSVQNCFEKNHMSKFFVSNVHCKFAKFKNKNKKIGNFLVCELTGRCSAKTRTIIIFYSGLLHNEKSFELTTTTFEFQFWNFEKKFKQQKNWQRTNLFQHVLQMSFSWFKIQTWNEHIVQKNYIYFSVVIDFIIH